MKNKLAKIIEKINNNRIAEEHTIDSFQMESETIFVDEKFRQQFFQ